MADVDRLVHMPVSEMVGESSEMDRFAEHVVRAVRATAAPNRKTGAYMESIKVKRIPGRGVASYVSDRLIYSDDPEAVQIEWGHWRNRDNKEAGYVPGQLIFTRTLESF